MDPITRKIVRSKDVVFLENFERKQEKKTAEIYPLVLETTVEEKTQEEKEVWEEETEDEADAISIILTATDNCVVIASSDSEYTSDFTSNSEADSVSQTNSHINNSFVLETAVPRRSSKAPKSIIRLDYVSYLTIESSTMDLISHSRSYGTLRQGILARNNGRRKKSSNKKGCVGQYCQTQGQISRTAASRSEELTYETYSPVIRYTSICFLCALTIKYLEMHQMDVAYLHGEIDEEIYVQQPKELLELNHLGQVWKLKKAIYGLKQSDIGTGN